MKKWLMVLVPILILVSLIVWRFEQKKTEMGGQASQSMSRSKMPASVELAKAEFRDIVSTFEAMGTVESIQNVKISPKVSGRIEMLEVREGDHVKQGQVLVRIDQSQVQAEVRQQKANLAEAKYRLAQAQMTQTTTDTSVSTQIRQQKANLMGAQADLKQAETTRRAQYETASASIEDAQNKIQTASASVANANANIRSAQANFDNANTKYQRILGLYKQGYVAAQDVDDAKTTVSVQQSSVETAKGQLQSATAALNSATTQKRSIEQQANITRAKADADLESAKAKVAQAEASLEYARANAQQSPAYRKSLEALTAAVAADQASLDASIAKLQDTVLRSPMDGVVTERNLDPGSLAPAGQPILAVQAMNKVWVTVAVPEDVCVKLHVNQPANVTFDSLDGKTFPARLAQINPSADLQSRQYTVRAILDNSKKQFTSGMFARVTLVTGAAKHVLSVPREAVEQDKDGGSYVIVAGKDRKARFSPIVEGVSDDKWVAVTSGLRPSERIVTMSASPVRDGQMISTGRRRGGRPGQGGPGGPGGSGRPRMEGGSDGPMRANTVPAPK